MTTLSRQIRGAFRPTLLSVVRVTTGLVSTIRATATGYSQASGDFVAAGFALGEELTGAGFPDDVNNAPRLVTGVTPLAITVDTATTQLVPRAPGSPVALQVALPQALLLAGLKGTDRPANRPYMQDWLLVSAAQMLSIGPKRRIENRGTYQVSFYYPLGYGDAAAEMMADTVVEAFFPGQELFSGGQKVTIVSARRVDSLSEPGLKSPEGQSWTAVAVHVPVSIEYKTYTLTPT